MGRFDPRPGRIPPLSTLVNKSLIIFFFPWPPRRHLPAKGEKKSGRGGYTATTAETLTTSSHYVKFICFFQMLKSVFFFLFVFLLLRGRKKNSSRLIRRGEERRERENEGRGPKKRERLSDSNECFGYAPGLRTLRNTAKMKTGSGAQRRGLPSTTPLFPSSRAEAHFQGKRKKKKKPFS